MPVGLRVLDKGEMLFGTELGNKILKTYDTELGLVVRYQCLWYFKLGEHVSFVEIEYVVCWDFGKLLGLDPLYEVIHCNDQVLVSV